MRWRYPNYAMVTGKATRGAIHTTGIKYSNAAGEFTPPIYCLDGSTDNSDNFQVKPTWVQGLLKVFGKYSCPTTETYDSSLAVRKI